MFKKIFQVILIIFFLAIFAYFKKDDFINNYKENQVYKTEIINLEKHLENFELSNIKKIKNIDFYYTPYKNLIDKMLSKIANAKDRIYIEMYMFTENKRFPNALVKAKNRWVEIKVILEKNPYKAPNINNKIFKFLQKNNIEVVWSKTSNYSLNHTKLFIIDDEIIISTWNLTYSTFAFNRDFFVFIFDKEIKNKLIELFLSDFIWRKKVVYHPNLVISPEYSKQKFKKIFLSANKSLKMYFQYLEEKELEQILISKAKQIRIQIVVSRNFYDNNKEKIDFLRTKNIEIYPLSKFKMHAKAILVDNNYLFIWSENFSSYSLTKNREVWIITKNSEVIQKFLEIFKKDAN